MSEKVAKRIRRENKQELSSHVIGAHNIDDVINKITRRTVAPLFIVIDLFCGAGGTTTGFDTTNYWPHSLTDTKAAGIDFAGENQNRVIEKAKV